MTNRAKSLSLLVVMMAVGCTSAVKRVIEERRARLLNTFKQLEKVAEVMKPMPPLTSASVVPGGTPFSFVPLEKDEADGTVALVAAADFAAFSELRAPGGTRPVNGTLFPECMSLMTEARHIGGATNNVHANVVQKYLDQCLAIRTVLVLRTHQADPPHTFEGDVLAFDLSTQKFLGGFPVKVSSEAVNRAATTASTTRSTRTSVSGRRTTTVTTTTGSTYDHDADVSNHDSDINDAVKAGIRTLLPGVTGLD
jgi:hypothetical protein